MAWPDPGPLGGDKRGLLGRKIGEREKGDERILGSGDFVNEALRKAGVDWEKRCENKMLLAKLIQKVASHPGLRKESILSGNRRRKNSEARSMISYLAFNDHSLHHRGSISSICQDSRPLWVHTEIKKVKKISAGRILTKIDQKMGLSHEILHSRPILGFHRD